jgi:hypothetical protein
VAQRVDARQRARENVAALRSLLGDGRAIPAIVAAVALSERHQDADELWLMAEVFRLGSLIVGEDEALAARRASLCERQPGGRPRGRGGC